ncbi:hypothetical protein [Noviherbaspirillum galbum]|uniref:Uncharacterized protein n=1 Tax=Noviherbaspirillum galbum TaxID=2709383 RepID=A0A6B3SWP4_9BURK|nr:hypothetical protein [Noviherbaspirillum galbum]NEX63416.1 hypothetical protein [Noviherbaspirillum galbum]
MHQLIMKSTTTVVFGSAAMMIMHGKPSMAVVYLLLTGTAYLAHRWTHA